MQKILFICVHRPDRSPSQRFRFEQYISYFESNGFACEWSYLIDEKDDKRFYSSGNLIHKFNVLIKSINKRLQDVSNAKNYDIVFIQREAFFLGTAFFEKKIAQSNTKLIFDFDDSIWLSNVSEGNKRLEWLKGYGKIKKIISLADVVIAGNNYLKQYAANYNQNVIVIPTTIDTDYHVPKLPEEKKSICIGWTGSPTTISHFRLIIPVLQNLKNKYGNKIYFKVIGDKHYQEKSLSIQGIEWKRESEIEDLHEFDIGIMPLVDDEWAKGKCGLKGLQYMALEIPTVMSAVGVNTEIIEEGKNGYLAANKNEWIEKLSLLIENEDLRSKLGKEARKTIENKYSVNSQKENYLNVFKELVS